jgi:hypothetical protein
LLTIQYDIMEFFRGDSRGQGAHDELARKIGSAGKIWSKTFYRKEDMIAYMFRCVSSLFSSEGSRLRLLCRLFLEYSRVMDVDRDNMAYHLDE